MEQPPAGSPRRRALFFFPPSFVAAGVLVSSQLAFSAPMMGSHVAARIHVKPAKVSVTTSQTRASAGQTTQFTIRTSKVDPLNNVVVRYGMSGTAILGHDYALPANSSSVTIPAGANLATLTLNVLSNVRPANRVVTLRLQAGAGYKISTPSKSSVTLMPVITPPTSTPSPTVSPSPSATPTSTPSPAPQQQIWIAVRNDGLPGTGTQADPFDGSTPQKFDTILHNYYFTPNIGVHLVGSGPFQTDVNHAWHVRPGWTISGEGMYSTTVRLVGSVAGWPGGVCVFASDPNSSTDNATISDLTIDCNWPALAATALDGADGEKNSGASAVVLTGTNNLLERVRCINSYGSWANAREQFALFLRGPRTGDGTNNVIRDCRAEMPLGTYGNPFALAGWTSSLPNHLITNSKVIGCTAVGLNSGLSTGFTSGGVNLANVKDVEVDGNTFIDCNSAAYIDAGQVDGLRVTNNSVVRGWMIVGLRCPGLKQNITISGNNFEVQNRFDVGASYGVYFDSGPITNLTITNNHFTFDPSGKGALQFWGIRGGGVTTATVSDNVFGYANPTLFNSISGSNITLLNNRMTDGALVTGLGN